MMQNKTKQINLQSHKIPDELKKFKNWVLWTYKQRNGKEAKIPKQKNGKEASIIDQETWTTFNHIINTHNQTNNQFDGIGFVFTNSPFMGIDIDNCRDSKTGKIQNWAKKIIQLSNSYSEISPSGTGIKILLKGKLPGEKKKKPQYYSGAIEIYDNKRYFTLTGNTIHSNIKKINDNQKNINSIYKLIFPDSSEKTSSITHRGGISDQEVINNTAWRVMRILCFSRSR